MAKLVICGTGPMAALACFYFTHDSPHRVVGFAADRAAPAEGRFEGLPVVPFDEVERHFAPALHGAFIADADGTPNAPRAARLEAVHAKGYAVASYLSSKAAHWPGLVLEDNCFVLEHVTIQPFARLGRDVVLMNGCQVGHHAVIGDHAQLGAEALIGAGVEVGACSVIGPRAMLLERIRLGRGSVIGPGCLRRTDTLDLQVVKDGAVLPTSYLGEHWPRGWRTGNGAAASPWRVAALRGGSRVVRN
jgi:UDP-3-O-[3-hydroxymyristoyl] glucosamine N-acyltransferase